MDRRTPFYFFHQSLNAKIVSFAGFLMPMHYQGVNFEHNHVRNNVGVFDVSHMAQIMITGSKAFDLVQYVTTNDVSKLINGKVQYSCILNKEGGVIDDLLVYRIHAESYMLVVNASNAQKDFDWICMNNQVGAHVENITSSRGLLAIQGPLSLKVLQPFTDINLNNIPYYSFKMGSFASCSDVIISNTGYTGSGGFELYMDKKHAEHIWKKLFTNNDELQPIGLAARDTLRLEMGYCLYGNDLQEDINPIEAKLSWIVHMEKDFIGKKALLAYVSDNSSKCLVGFVLEDRGIPRKNYEIFNKNSNKIGYVTSGTMSPSLKLGLGMGYVLKKDASIGNQIFICVRGKHLKAKIVKMPFYDKK